MLAGLRASWASFSYRIVPVDTSISTALGELMARSGFSRAVSSPPISCCGSSAGSCSVSPAADGASPAVVPRAGSSGNSASAAAAASRGTSCLTPEVRPCGFSFSEADPSGADSSGAVSSAALFSAAAPAATSSSAAASVPVPMSAVPFSLLFIPAAMAVAGAPGKKPGSCARDRTADIIRQIHFFFIYALIYLLFYNYTGFGGLL